MQHLLPLLKLNARQHRWFLYNRSAMECSKFQLRFKRDRGTSTILQRDFSLQIVIMFCYFILINCSFITFETIKHVNLLANLLETDSQRERKCPNDFWLFAVMYNAFFYTLLPTITLFKWERLRRSIEKMRWRNRAKGKLSILFTYAIAFTTEQLVRHVILWLTSVTRWTFY